MTDRAKAYKHDRKPSSPIIMIRELYTMQTFVCYNDRHNEWAYMLELENKEEWQVEMKGTS